MNCHRPALLLFTWVALVPVVAPAGPTTMRAGAVETKDIYHSPQTPGYTAWCTLWRVKAGELRVAFQQVTGPVDDWPKRANVTVVLGSADEGATWAKVRESPARPSNATEEPRIYAAPGSSSFCGHAMAVLADGTLVTGLWPAVGSWRGYVQRSSDDGVTWSPPIDLVDPGKFKVYPSQVHVLRDGRLILMAGLVNRAEPDQSARVDKVFFESRDGGRTWGKPVELMPRKVGVCEESDFVELVGGDLLFVHRTEHYDADGKFLGANRLQNVVKRNTDGAGWTVDEFTETPIPHSGFPELLKTVDGLILHVGTDGVWQTADEGRTWTKVEGAPQSPYYPRATPLRDGRILIVGHVGGDDEYGKVDQRIVQQTFRLEPAAAAK